MALHPAHPLKDSSVRTMLRRLEAHGYLHHRVEEKTFVYEARLSPQRIAATSVRHIIDRFCSGSVEQFLAGMVDENVLSATQIAQLAAQAGAGSGPKTPKERKKQKKRKKRDKRRNRDEHPVG